MSLRKSASNFIQRRIPSVAFRPKLSVTPCLQQIHRPYRNYSLHHFYGRLTHFRNHLQPQSTSSPSAIPSVTARPISTTNTNRNHPLSHQDQPHQTAFISTEDLPISATAPKSILAQDIAVSLYRSNSLP
ncbi:hypothetical protein LXL04_032210 [Taraxacum kok-saghyz]